MRLTITTYNGTNINDGTNYRAYFPAGSIFLQPETEAIEIERSNKEPVYAGTIIRSGHTIPLCVIMLGNIADQIDDLRKLINTKDPEPVRLVAVDESAVSWYLMVKPIQQPDIDGQQITFLLSVSDTFWRTSTENTDAWIINTTGSTNTITVNGHLPVPPKFYVTPTAIGGHGYGFARFAVVKNQTTRIFTNYPFDVASAGFNSAALISAGTIQSDGDDVSVYVDGQEVDRWLGFWNQSTSRIWINLNLRPLIRMGLLTPIASSGAITTIEVARTNANKTNITNLPSEGMVQIDDEIFTYTGKSPDKWQLTGVKRAAKGTAEAVHTVGDNVDMVEHDIWIFYGNSASTAPPVNDALKPILNLDTSTNTLWDYDEFMDYSLLRSGIWLPAVQNTSNSVDDDRKTNYYTADRRSDANPATEMGMSILSYQVGTTWKTENGRVVWQIYIPSGVTTVTMSGEKYRQTSNWASVARLFRSNDGTNWTGVGSTESTPSSAQTWAAMTGLSSASLSGTFRYLRLTFSGSLSATADNAMHMEVGDVTLVLDSSAVPTVSLATATGNYQLLSRVTNTATGEWIFVEYSMAIGNTVLIDCENKKIVGPDGDRSDRSITFSSRRQEWLNLQPGVNVLQFDDAGTVGASIATYWQDRNP